MLGGQPQDGRGLGMVLSGQLGQAHLPTGGVLDHDVSLTCAADASSPGQRPAAGALRDAMRTSACRRVAPGTAVADAGERVVQRSRGELADAPRAEDAHYRAEGEVVLRRHDAGEGAEEPVGLLLVGGDGGEEAALAGPGRGKGGQAEGEVVDAADGPVAPALMILPSVGPPPVRAKP